MCPSYKTLFSLLNDCWKMKTFIINIVSQSISLLSEEGRYTYQWCLLMKTWHPSTDMNKMFRYYPTTVESVCLEGHRKHIHICTWISMATQGLLILQFPLLGFPASDFGGEYNYLPSSAFVWFLFIVLDCDWVITIAFAVMSAAFSLMMFNFFISSHFLILLVLLELT